MVIEKLTKYYLNTIIFNEVNLTINSSGLYYLYAPNGSGKTTLFKCILNLEDYNGIINCDEEKYAIFDDNPLYLNLNSYQNITYLLNNKISNNEILELGKYFFEDENILNKKVEKLSLGQRKIVGMMAMLLSERNFLIIDELTNGLDQVNKRKVYSILKGLSKNKIIIATGHDINFYKALATKCYTIVDNQIKEINKSYIGEYYE